MSAERVKLTVVATVLEAAGPGGLSWTQLCDRASGERTEVEVLVGKLVRTGFALVAGARVLKKGRP